MKSLFLSSAAKYNRFSKISLMVFGMVFIGISPQLFADVVINEIHYNPPDNDLEAGSLREFIELYNPDSQAIDLSGYSFTQGITYSFPVNTQISSGAYLVIARVPTYSSWRNKSYKVYGPYQGALADTGETLTLRRPDGLIADSVKYSDHSPWPLGADGYGSSLERIAANLPSDDFHSWRASVTSEGTPGKLNSVAGIESKPVIQAVQVTPAHPTSSDSVTVNLGLDAPEWMASAVLLWEIAGSSKHVVPMTKVSETIGSATFQAVIPANPSQSLIRFNAEIQLTDGATIRLPHEAEPRPFFSYFVYDGEVQSPLPILWILPQTATTLLKSSRSISGAVCLQLNRNVPDVFDGAMWDTTRNGNKLHFLKGEEFYGDRTINLSPEIPTGGTNPGVSAPFREHLGYWFFREMGCLCEWSDFYRVITLPSSSGVPQAQREVFQQVNEQFLVLNGLNPEGDLYKLVYSRPNWEKHTNKETGSENVEALVAALKVSDPVRRRETMEQYLDLDGFLIYSVASVFTSNWDGYWNNNWMYLDPMPGSRWKIIPWDLDWLWGATTRTMYYAEMPLTFPIDGVATGGLEASRDPGRITAPVHKDTEFFQQYLLRMRYEMTHTFSQDKLFNKIDEMQKLLLDDLQLIEQQTGTKRASRYNQIRTSYNDIKSFITQRRQYLDSVLPVGVESWEIY